jgi:hypothetical protein
VKPHSAQWSATAPSFQTRDSPEFANRQVCFKSEEGNQILFPRACRIAALGHQNGDAAIGDFDTHAG